MKVKIKKVPKAQQGVSMPTTNSNLHIDGPYQQLTPDIIKLNGERHSKGGQDISYGGTPVEAEGTETIYTKNDGNAVVFGNMLLPGTNKTFKSISEDLAIKQNKANSYANIGTELVNNNDPYGKWESLKFNAGRAMLEGGRAKVQQLKDDTEHLSTVQQALLSVAKDMGVEPIPLSKGKLKTTKENVTQYKYGGNLFKAQDGTDLYNIGTKTNNLQQIAREEAYRYNIDPDIFIRQINAESNFKPTSTGAKGIKGIAQLSEDERRKYGITDSEATSSNLQAIRKNLNAAAQIMSSNIQRYNGDYGLALAAYNGGPKSLEGAKNWANKNNIPFNGDTWLKYQENRQQNNPTKKGSAWQNETYNYVKSITSGKGIQDFNNTYYNNSKNSLDTVPNSNTPSIANYTTNQEVIPIDPQIAMTATRNLDPVTVSSKSPAKQPNIQRSSYNYTPTKRNIKDIPFQATQILPEIYAMSQNTPQGVFQQNYQPDLYTPYQVSFQDRINDNNQTFNALRQNSYIADNPTALASMAGQLYDANNRVRADEFRTNQAISNDITNKNVSLLNEAQRTNLSLQDQAYVRQTQAASNTRELNYGLLNSITNKINQWQVENELYRRQQPLYDYTYNGNGYETQDPNQYQNSLQSVFQGTIPQNFITQPNTITTSTYNGNDTAPTKRVVKFINK